MPKNHNKMKYRYKNTKEGRGEKFPLNVTLGLFIQVTCIELTNKE